MSNPIYPSYQPPMYPAYQARPMQMPQMQQPVAQSVMTLVTSKEQALVAQIPFDGQPYFFANTSNDEIYAKRFDPSTGQSPLVTYKREMPVPEQAYAPLAVVEQLSQQMQAMQDALQSMTAPRGKKTTAPREEETA